MTSPHPVSLPIRRVTRLDLTCDAWRWPFAEQRRGEIDSYFARLRQAKPELWNGRVLLAREPRFTPDTLHARYFETDFSSFLAWRDWGFPDTAIVNGFGMGALRGCDGGYVLGEMSRHTANAGKIYFPSGMLDLSDLNDGQVDMAGNVVREVNEETGLTADDYAADPAWDVIAILGRVAMIRRLDAKLPAFALQTRIGGFIAQEPKSELSAVHLVHTRSDISPAMPDFIAAYLSAQFDGPALTADASHQNTLPGVRTL